MLCILDPPTKTIRYKDICIKYVYFVQNYIMDKPFKREEGEYRCSWSKADMQIYLGFLRCMLVA